MRYFFYLLFFFLTFSFKSNADDTKEYVSSVIKEAIQEKTKSLDPVHISFYYWPKQMHRVTIDPDLFKAKSLDISIEGDTFITRVPCKRSEITLKGKITPLENLPVLKSTMNSVISADDITFARFPADKIKKEDVARDVGDLIGKQPIGSVQALQPISKKRLKEPLAVHRGQIVEVVYNSNRLMVSTRAKAQKDATIGQEIALEVLSSHKDSQSSHAKKVIHAIVIADGKAKVGYA